jgi:hypothetical protein
MLASVSRKETNYTQQDLHTELLKVTKLKDSLKQSDNNNLLSDYENLTLEELSVIEDLLVYLIPNYSSIGSQTWANKYNEASTETYS